MGQNKLCQVQFPGIYGAVGLGQLRSATVRVIRANLWGRMKTPARLGSGSLGHSLVTSARLQSAVQDSTKLLGRTKVLPELFGIVRSSILCCIVLRQFALLNSVGQGNPANLFAAHGCGTAVSSVLSWTQSYYFILWGRGYLCHFKSV
jgi:hypothetical protein